MSIVPFVLSPIGALTAAASTSVEIASKQAAPIAGKIAVQILQPEAASKITSTAASMLRNTIGSVAETCVNIEKSNAYKAFKLPSDCLGHIFRYFGLPTTALAYFCMEKSQKGAENSAAIAARAASDSLQAAETMGKILANELKNAAARERKFLYTMGAVAGGALILGAVGAGLYFHYTMQSHGAKFEKHTQEIATHFEGHSKLIVDQLKLHLSPRSSSDNPRDRIGSNESIDTTQTSDPKRSLSGYSISSTEASLTPTTVESQTADSEDLKEVTKV